jgi:hypothetical protein
MKKPICFFVILVLAAFDLPAQTDLIARIHFLGGDRIAADTNSPAFTNEFCSPEARAFESQILDKLSALPTAWFQAKLPVGTIDGPAQLRPLLDDFLKTEWCFEIRDATNGSPEYALAIRLDDGRAQLWSKNLRTLLESWTKISTQNTPEGWMLKKDLPPNLFEFSRKGDWVVLDCGQNELPLGPELIGSVLKSTEANWLTVNLDWPRLAQIYPALQTFDCPRFRFQMTGEGGNLHFDGQLNLAQPLPGLPDWQIPTNVIHGTFVSFTAGRGMGPWLQRQSWFEPFQLQPQPEQFFTWALPQNPFGTFTAEPVPDATAALVRLGQDFDADTDWHRLFILPVKTTVADDKLFFGGIPFMVPSIQADRETNGAFLVGGFFPVPPGEGIIPDDLQKELNLPNLVYYHWEVTRDRLEELPRLSQLLLLITHHQQLGKKTPGAVWLNQIQPLLGASVTAAAKSGPQSVSFVRSAPVGLNAIELFLLVDWLESPTFPSLELPKAPDE